MYLKLLMVDSETINIHYNYKIDKTNNILLVESETIIMLVYLNSMSLQIKPIIKKNRIAVMLKLANEILQTLLS